MTQEQSRRLAIAAIPKIKDMLYPLVRVYYAGNVELTTQFKWEVYEHFRLPIVGNDVAGHVRADIDTALEGTVNQILKDFYVLTLRQVQKDIVDGERRLRLKGIEGANWAIRFYFSWLFDRLNKFGFVCYNDVNEALDTMIDVINKETYSDLLHAALDKNKVDKGEW